MPKKPYDKQKTEAATRAYFERALAQYKNSRVIKGVKIIGANDPYVCQGCRAIRNREYTLVEVPKLPYKNCISELGCRCGIVPVVKSPEEMRFKKHKGHK